jgi:DNA primase
MRFGDGLLEEIRRRTDVVQLVGRRVKLTRKGNVFWGVCPFHKEKTGSFKVENERRTYHCFGCGAGGDCFKWLQETEGLTFPESVQRLAQEASVELPAWSPEDEARESRRKSLYEIIALASDFFEQQLRGPAGTTARNYVKSRGLSSEVCRRFRIGYAPDSSGALREHLTAKGVALADMIEAGLARAADDGRPARDFFYDRIMFPIEDVRGRVIAFGGRGMSPDAKPKYINTGETTLFSKGRQLYNFRAAREVATKGAPLILAEGYMDVIALSEAGFAGAVAPLGTALTEEQLALLWNVAPEPVLCLDGDEAGTRAAKRAARLALPHLSPGKSLKFVFLPGGEDPDSFLRSQGTEPMRVLLEKAQPLADVLWAGETEGRDFSTPERRAGLEAELDQLVKAIRDPKIADYYKRDFGDRVFRAFKQRRPAASSSSGGARRPWPPAGRPQTGFRGGKPMGGPRDEGVSAAVRRSVHAVNAHGAARSIKEKELLGLLLTAPILIERHAETVAELAFQDPQLDRLKRELLHLAASGVTLERTVVENHLVRQGLSMLAERLTAQTGVQGVRTGVAEGAFAGSDEAIHEAAWRRTLAQLHDPEMPAHGDLKARRDAALKRYLDGGAHEDWDELQRVNGLIRSASAPQ